MHYCWLLNIEYAQMAHVIDVDHKLMYWNDREEFLEQNELFHRKMEFIIARLMFHHYPHVLRFPTFSVSIFS